MTRRRLQPGRSLGRVPPVRPALALPALLAGWVGCALTPKLGPPPNVGPPYIPPPEPVWVVLDPALLRAGPDTGSAGSRATRPAVRRRLPVVESGPPDDPGLEVEPPSPGTPPAGIEGGLASPDATTATRPNLLVDLPAADRRQLDEAARRNLAAADSLARQADRRPLPPRQREKLENALGLVRQAREALRRGDLRAAANLAYKARLLAGEVSR